MRGESNLRKVAALWKRTSKAGNIFYSGQIDAEAMKSALVGDETNLLLFKVKEKRSRGPDLELFTAQDTRKPVTPSAEPETVPAAIISDFDDDTISFWS